MAVSRVTPSGWLDESGSLSRVTPFGWVQESQSTGGTTHEAAGTLSGPGSSITGESSHVGVHTASGELTAGSGAISGEAQRTGQATVHEASGALITGSGSITGSASRVRLHDVSGALSVGSGSISGEATRSTPGVGSFSTPPLKNNTGTLLANVAGWTVNVYNVSTGALVVQKTGLSTNASGVLTVSDAAISSATTYAYEPVHATYGRRLPTAVAA